MKSHKFLGLLGLKYSVLDWKPKSQAEYTFAKWGGHLEKPDQKN